MLCSELPIINSRVKCNHKIPKFFEDLWRNIDYVSPKTPEFYFLGPFSKIHVLNIILMDVGLGVGWGVQSRKYVPWPEKMRSLLRASPDFRALFSIGSFSGERESEGDLFVWCNKETLGIGLYSIPLARNRCLCAVSSSHCLISSGTVFKPAIPQ